MFPSLPELHSMNELPVTLFDRVFIPAVHPPANSGRVTDFYDDPNSTFRCVSSFPSEGSLGSG
jgi:hypothetical protein